MHTLGVVIGALIDSRFLESIMPDMMIMAHNTPKATSNPNGLICRSKTGLPELISPNIKEWTML